MNILHFTLHPHAFIQLTSVNLLNVFEVLHFTSLTTMVFYEKATPGHYENVFMSWGRGKISQSNGLPHQNFNCSHMVGTNLYKGPTNDLFVYIHDDRSFNKCLIVTRRKTIMQLFYLFF